MHNARNKMAGQRRNNATSVVLERSTPHAEKPGANAAARPPTQSTHGGAFTSQGRAAPVETGGEAARAPIRRTGQNPVGNLGSGPIKGIPTSLVM